MEADCVLRASDFAAGSVMMSTLMRLVWCTLEGVVGSVRGWRTDKGIIRVAGLVAVSLCVLATACSQASPPEGSASRASAPPSAATGTTTEPTGAPPATATTLPSLPPATAVVRAANRERGWLSDSTEQCSGLDRSLALDASLDPAVVLKAPVDEPLIPGATRVAIRSGTGPMVMVHPVSGDLVWTSSYDGGVGITTIGRWDRPNGRYTRLLAFDDCAIIRAFSDGTTVWIVADGAMAAFDLSTAAVRWRRGLNGVPVMITEDATALHFANPGPDPMPAWAVATVAKATGETLGVKAVDLGVRTADVGSDQGSWRLEVDEGGQGTVLREVDVATGLATRRHVFDVQQGFVDQVVVADGTMWVNAHVGAGPRTVTRQRLDPPTDEVPVPVHDSTLFYGPSGLWALVEGPGSDGDHHAYTVYKIDTRTGDARTVTQFTRAVGHDRGAHGIFDPTVTATGLQFVISVNVADDALVEVTA
jgi:hypothetical protein